MQTNFLQHMENFRSLHGNMPWLKLLQIFYLLEVFVVYHPSREYLNFLHVAWKYAGYFLKKT